MLNKLTIRQIQSIRLEGALAHRQGYGVDDHPYPIDADSRRCWIQGWRAQERKTSTLEHQKRGLAAAIAEIQRRGVTVQISHGDPKRVDRRISREENDRRHTEEIERRAADRSKWGDEWNQRGDK